MRSNTFLHLLFLSLFWGLVVAEQSSSNEAVISEVDDAPRKDNSLSAETLKPGEMKPVTWKKDGKPITSNLYKIGLPPTVRTELLRYIKDNGLLDKFQSIDTDPLKAGRSRNQLFGDEKWYVQRPRYYWNSNMHWISPADAQSQESYLRALGDGGLDQTLDTIGKYLGMDGVVCYQLTFIGVTNCTKGYMHHDFEDTNGKAFNLIIPLMLVEDSGPELDILADNEEVVGIKYETDVGIMVGDGAYHATGNVDHTGTGNVRLAATVYLADVNEENVNRIVGQYTQVYPPIDRDFLLRQRGLHWRKETHLPRSSSKDTVNSDGAMEA